MVRAGPQRAPGPDRGADERVGLVRYVPRPDGNAVIRDRIVDLAQRHRRYGAGLIYLKLRQAGHVINHKRVDRLYTAARLQLKRRRRKKVPITDRQPLVRPDASQPGLARTSSSSTADGRVMTGPDHRSTTPPMRPWRSSRTRALGGLPVTRILDRLAITRGLPQISARTTGRSSAVAQCSHGRTRRG